MIPDGAMLSAFFQAMSATLGVLCVVVPGAWFVRRWWRWLDSDTEQK